MNILKTKIFDSKQYFQWDIDIRESFSSAPKLINYILTFISGKPAANEIPPFNLSPVAAITIDILKIIAGVFLTCIFYLKSIYFLIPFFWLLTLNGVRSLISDSHYAAHGAVTGNKKVDLWVGEILSLFVFFINMKDYINGHNKKHHGPNGIKSTDDPGFRMMLLMGFKPGKPEYWYWIRLILVIFSPRIYIYYTYIRIKSNFINAPLRRKLLAYIIYGPILALIAYHHLGMLFFTAWVVPVILLAPISAGLQFATEHFWLLRDNLGLKKSRLALIRKRSFGRFFLYPAPKRNLNIGAKLFAWVYWSIAMIPLVFERFFVCVSVIPAHDYHHRHACNKNWPLEHYGRQKEIDNGVQDYHEYYGLREVLKLQFKIWSLSRERITIEYFTFFGLFDSFARKVLYFFKVFRATD